MQDREINVAYNGWLAVGIITTAIVKKVVRYTENCIGFARKFIVAARS